MRKVELDLAEFFNEFNDSFALLGQTEETDSQYVDRVGRQGDPSLRPLSVESEAKDWEAETVDPRVHLVRMYQSRCDADVEMVAALLGADADVASVVTELGGVGSVLPSAGGSWLAFRMAARLNLSSAAMRLLARMEG